MQLPLTERPKVPKRFRIEFIWVAFFILYLLFFGIRGIWNQQMLAQRHDNLLKDIAEAKKINAQQKIQLQRLQDNRYLEFLARDRLGLVKPGEKVYKLSGAEGGSVK